MTRADLPALRSALHDESRPRGDQTAAANSLARLGEPGSRALIGAFEDEQIAATAVKAFASAGPDAVSALIETLAHERPESRGAAAEAIGLLALNAGDVTPHLQELLKDPVRDVRFRVVRALHAFGPKSASAAPAVIEVLRNERETEPTRQWAIKTLIVMLGDTDADANSEAASKSGAKPTSKPKAKTKTRDLVVQALIDASKVKTNYGVSQLARQQVLRLAPNAAAKAGVK